MHTLLINTLTQGEDDNPSFPQDSDTQKSIITCLSSWLKVSDLTWRAFDRWCKHPIECTSTSTSTAAGAASFPSPTPSLHSSLLSFSLLPFLLHPLPPWLLPFFLQAQPVIADACLLPAFSPEIINLEGWLRASSFPFKHIFSFKIQSCIFSNGVPILKQGKNND